MKRDTFTADPASGARWARRIPKPTQITNVYAILRGTDPAQAKRMVLVTGHYDSRNSNVRKNWTITGAAPGRQRRCFGRGRLAGVRTGTEQVEVSRQRSCLWPWPARSRDWWGRATWPSWHKDEGWQLEAVLNNDIVGGNTTPGDTLQLKDRVRVFSEGVPQAATPEEARAHSGIWARKTTRPAVNWPGPLPRQRVPTFRVRDRQAVHRISCRPA